MALRRYRLVTTITATANASDYFTASRAGILKQVVFCTNFDCITDNGVAKCQVSRSAVGDFGATGGTITQTLAQQNLQSNLLTSGISQADHNLVVSCNDKIALGEALYLNSFASGTVSANVEVLLVIEES